MGFTTVDMTAHRFQDARAAAGVGQAACRRAVGPAAGNACVSMSQPITVAGVCLAALVLLAGCTATGSNTVAPIPATADTVSPKCPAWVTPCVDTSAGPLVGDVGDLPRLVKTADDLLFAGDEKAAWQQLNEALKIDPKHRPALLLMSQISDDPRKLLGDMNEPYIVATGESLRQIAAARLGDARLFYALARYNNIAVPRQLDAGRSILLPLPATSAGPARAAAARRAASGVDSNAASGSAAAPASTSRAPAPPVTPAPPTPQASPGGPGPAATAVDAAPRAGAGVRAVTPVAPVAESAMPGAGTTSAARPAASPGATGAGAPARPGGDADLAFKRAAAAEKAGKTEQAYAGFMRALALGHPGAAERAGALRQDLIAQQRRVARTALDRQNLDVAIKALRTVLELDPGDTVAADELRKAQRRRDTQSRR